MLLFDYVNIKMQHNIYMLENRIFSDAYTTSIYVMIIYLIREI